VIGSSRRNTRDLAVVRALGFRRRQVVVAALVQVLVLATVAFVVGTVLGVAAGRTVWGVTQRNLFVLDATSVPWHGVELSAVAALASASAAATVLAYWSIRRPVGEILRTQ
jgi:predicted lysophospholipase L1 biosynthesis ABC-type transport system permease subunit